MPLSDVPWGVGGQAPVFGFDVNSFAGTSHDLVLELVSHTIGEKHAVVSIYPGNQRARIMDGMPLLDASVRTISVFGLRLVDTIGGPSFCIEGDSKVLQFPMVSASDFTNVVSSCAGMGIGCLGFEHVGMDLVVANDINPNMLLGHSVLHPTVPTVLGDIADPDTVCRMHQIYPRSGVLFSGFNCQPYSKGGKQQGALDDRSKVLPATLKAAYMLHSVAVVLECVRDAGSNNFVRTMVDAFCTQCGFHVSEVALSLDACWTSKRDRWWAVLSVPFLGKVSLPSLPSLPFPLVIRHVVPRPLSLLDDELAELALDDFELTQFNKFAPSIASFFPNVNTSAPTALHSWSNQVVPCHCGCRPFGFAEETLAARGLYGILWPLEGCSMTEDGLLQKARHPHPTEIALLNSVPLPEAWPQDLRLVNSALGQMATPLHTNWILAHLRQQVEKVHLGTASMCPNRALDALRTQVLQQAKKLQASPGPIEIDFDLPQWEPTATHVTLMPWEQVTIAAPTNQVVLLGDIGCPSLKLEVTSPCLLEQVLRAEIALGSLPGDLVLLMQTWAFWSCPDGALLELNHDVAGRVIWVQHITPLLEDSEPDEEMVPLSLVVSPTVPWSPLAEPGVEVHDSELVPCPDPWAEVKALEMREILESDPLTTLSAAELTALAPPRVLSPNHGLRLRSQQMSAATRRAVLVNQDYVWADDEITWHVKSFLAQSKRNDVAFLEPLLATEALFGVASSILRDWFDGLSSRPRTVVTVVWLQGHWVPFSWNACNDTLFARTWEHPSVPLDSFDALHDQLKGLFGVNCVMVHREHRDFADSTLCGLCAVRWLDHLIRGKMLLSDLAEAQYLHSVGRSIFTRYLLDQERVDRPWIWGAGLDAPVKNKLKELLLQHGVPTATVEQRIQLLSEALGVQSVTNSLQGSRPWRSLKSLCNQKSPPFQLVLPAELQQVVEARAKTGQVAKRKKKPVRPDGKPVARPPVVLDANKLQVEKGVFQVGSKALSQIPLRQVGPYSEGVVLSTLQECEKFLKANQTVTANALGLLLINQDQEDLQTDLKWSRIRVVLRCITDHEPILVSACLVQLGEQPVTQPSGLNLDVLPSVPAACIKISIYRDETSCTWEEITSGPIKFLMKMLPALTACREDPKTCECAKLHVNPLSEVQDPVLDLWRRQWLSSGFKQCNSDMASIYMVNLRIVESLQLGLLSASGHHGIYIEPRSLDSLKPSDAFQTIWVPRVDVQELQRRQQLDPLIIGLCRLGSRLGVRVASGDAKQVAERLRPDTVFLASGTRMMFELGPIPFGMDRLAVTKLCSNWGWEARPLNPSKAMGQLGMIWKVQSCTDPPRQVVLYRGGEILITKLAVEAPGPQQEKAVPLLATASTLAKCVLSTTAVTEPTDPWLKQDPWGGTKMPVAPSTAEIEERLKQQVLDAVKSQQETMEVDGTETESRLQLLEKQMQEVRSAQVALEAKVDDSTKRLDTQVSSLQDQVGSQFSIQNQRIQELFSKQMHEMEALLSKRSRSRSRRE